MPAYNFQKQFVEPILKGEKPHTIRARRKNPTKVEDRLYLYTDLRTKKAFKFAEATCSWIQPVVIYPVKHEVQIGRINADNYVWMDEEELNDLALRDGFGSVRDFFSFFLDTYKREMLDGFEVIWWDYETLKDMASIGGRDDE
jgi:hypothetical protein